MAMVLWLLGCSLPTDFCAREEDWLTRCGDPPAAKDVRACEKSVQSCSDADLDVLDAYGACLDSATCGSEAFFDCAAGLVALEDPACGFGG